MSTYDRNLIYDVGLFNGDDTSYYLSQGYRVVAIEADPDLASEAQQRFQTFIDQGRLKILNIGIADVEGRLPFYINEKHREWNSFDLSIAGREDIPYQVIDIQTKTFDNVIKTNGVPYYLKVDIEGNDYLCIRGLDGGNIPKFISIEANHIGLFNDLFGKGFTKFKLVFQYNLAHLELPPNKYFKRWLWGFNIRQLNSLPVKILRKIGGEKFFHWHDRFATPSYSQSFNKGSSGNFGENLGGEWYSLDTALKIYQYYHDVFHNLPNKKEYGFWVDIHATW